MPLHPLDDPFLAAYLDARQIPILGQTIDPGVQETVTASLLFLNTLNAEPITLLIDCQGGYVLPVRLIIDAVEASRAPVDGLVVGVAVSAAFILLQRCRRRMAYRHALVMAHGPMLTAFRPDDPGSRKTMKKAVAEFEHELRFLARRTGQPVRSWRAWCANERKFTAVEAKKLGIIDKVIGKS